MNQYIRDSIENILRSEKKAKANLGLAQMQYDAARMYSVWPPYFDVRSVMKTYSKDCECSNIWHED